MKLHIFAVSYYVQQAFDDGKEKTFGPVLLQPPVNVAAETQEEAIALVKAADGFERTVTGVANGTQDVLVADPAPTENSEVDSLKASLAALSDENAKLVEVNKAIESDVVAAAQQVESLKASNAALTAKIATIQGDLAKATEQLNQKPQPQPPQPIA